jgi:hypothetical protein
LPTEAALMVKRLEANALDAHEVAGPSASLSFNVCPPSPDINPGQCPGHGVIAGGKDDHVRAYSASGVATPVGVMRSSGPRVDQ